MCPQAGPNWQASRSTPSRSQPSRSGRARTAGRRGSLSYSTKQWREDEEMDDWQTFRGGPNDEYSPPLTRDQLLAKYAPREA